MSVIALCFPPEFKGGIAFGDACFYEENRLSILYNLMLTNFCSMYISWLAMQVAYWLEMIIFREDVVGLSFDLTASPTNRPIHS